MKKLSNYFFVLTAALAMVFTSCSDDENALGPNIVFKAGTDLTTGDATVDQGATVNFSWEVNKGDAKLAEFTIRIGALDADGFPVDNIDKDQYEDTYSVTLLDAGVYEFTFIATDKDGLKDIKTIVITAEAATTPLSAEKTFTLTYKGSTQTDGLNKYEDLGIEYDRNVDANTAAFATISGQFVIIDAAKYTSISSVQELLIEFEAGTVVSEFQAKSDANFVDKYFISKPTTGIYLLHLTDLSFAAGNNQADFAYKE
jgi:hypothetical protein